MDVAGDSSSHHGLQLLQRRVGKLLNAGKILKELKSLHPADPRDPLYGLQDAGFTKMAALLANKRHNKSATYSAGMQKTYSLICLTMDDDKNPKIQKATKKLSFLSWGFRNRQKAASTLCLASPATAKPQSSKLFLSPYDNRACDSAMY